MRLMQELLDFDVDLFPLGLFGLRTGDRQDSILVFGVDFSPSTDTGRGTLRRNRPK
jgi:hypothetical protein